nr:hypothetical protein L203_00987 [Cryptococcus depauperatus CBS 7841]
MDLVVLLSPLLTSEATTKPHQPFFRALGGIKGKNKDERKTRVSLWRSGQGDKVWEVEVGGRVGGMAWMESGLYLSTLVISSHGKTIDTLSVHSGEVARSTPIELDVPELSDGQWIDMYYPPATLEWEKPLNGSAMAIIDSLPKVTPVEPPKPVSTMPFMRPKDGIQAKASLHPLLLTFPSLLPSNPPVPPVVLQIQTSYPSSISLLTGTLPLSTRPTREVLSLAQMSDRMLVLLDTALRGFENVEAAFRECEKQTMIHREDLETSGKQQGVSIADVHADMFRFLMTGRTGVVVSEWLGSRMTPRTIAKWDTILDTSYKNIQKLISQSIYPALERILLLLEDMRGWSLTQVECYSALINFVNGFCSPRFKNLLPATMEVLIQERMNMVAGLGKLVEKMRLSAQHEMLAAAEFIKWLKYDEPPFATYDLKLVWSFMQNGFVNSPFRYHFPDLLDRPPKDQLPNEIVTKLNERPQLKSLNQALREMITCLQKMPGNDKQSANMSATDNQNLSMSLSLVMEDVSESFALGPNDSVDLSFASSIETVAQRDRLEEEPKSVRLLEKEPWVWMNSVIKSCETLIREVVTVSEGEKEDDRGLWKWDGLRDVRDANESRWMALVSSAQGQNSQLSLICHRPSEQNKTFLAAFKLIDENEAAECLAIQFLDDEEVVLFLQQTINQQCHLVTIRYKDLLADMWSVPLQMDYWTVQDLVKLGQSETFKSRPLPIARSRPLASHPTNIRAHRSNASIALNGRKGRRFGCIYVESEEGREVEVLDFDANEDDSENEEMDDGENE